MSLWTTAFSNQQYTVGIDTYIAVFTFGGADYKQAHQKSCGLHFKLNLLSSGVTAIDAPALCGPMLILLWRPRLAPSVTGTQSSQLATCWLKSDRECECLRHVVFRHKPGLAQLDVLRKWEETKTYKNEVYLQSKELEGKEAKLHVLALNANLTILSQNKHILYAEINSNDFGRSGNC